MPGSVDASEAPYFVDLVRDQLVQRLGDRDFNREGLRIYTSLDPDLQRAATAAVDSTIHVMDEQVDKLYARRKKLGERIVYPQVALVALNPHTGQVLALVGGRSYGASQLNHAVAKRPTGSIFKPFVYATAFQTAVEGTHAAGTDQAVFAGDDAERRSRRPTTWATRHIRRATMRASITARCTARYALMRSTEQRHHRPGMRWWALTAWRHWRAMPASRARAERRRWPSDPMTQRRWRWPAPTPSLPITECIWTRGCWPACARPPATSSSDYTPTSKQVLDPRVAFLTTNMMEAVLQAAKGTGAGVRNMGFTAPAAGKTGTSHDAWFAGFTSNLLCIVWVGNDDYTDIKLEGAHAAAPIWAEFMKKAVQLPQYSDTNEFTPPDGVEVVSLDKVTNLLSDAACPDSYDAAFLDGTAPTETCDHPADHRNILQKIFGLGEAGELAANSASCNSSIDIGAVGHGLAARAPEGDARVRPLNAALRIGSPQRRQGSPVRP